MPAVGTSWLAILLRIAVVCLWAARPRFCQAEQEEGGGALQPPLPPIPEPARDAFLDDEIAQSDGAWLAGYARLHAMILAGTVPAARQRFAVWTCSPLDESVPIGPDSTRLCAGFANRVMGLTAAFLYAVLTERALIVEWPPPAEDYIGHFLHSPYFDWTPPPRAALEGADETPLILDTRLGRTHVRRELSTFDWRHDHQHRVVRLTLLEGYFDELLSNKSLRHACQAGLGLHDADHVIGRLARILLRPDPSIRRLVQSHLLGRPPGEHPPNGRASRPCATLGIQIRLGATGGGARGQVGLQFSELDRFLAAADAISRSHQPGAAVGRDDSGHETAHAGCAGVAWVLAADSIDVVRAVQLTCSHRHVVWFNATTASGRDGMGSIEDVRGAQVGVSSSRPPYSLFLPSLSLSPSHCPPFRRLVCVSG